MASTPAPCTPAPPPGAVPPVLTQRRSSQYSREERGAAWSSSSFGADTGTPQLPVKTLFGVGEARQASRMQRTIFLCLLALSAWAWLPVVRWALSTSPPPPQPQQPLESAPHVHVFHEARCAGESLSLGARPADVCDLSYPSGESVKDNAASVLLFGDAGAAGWELRVYGTCRLAEQPPNPMLLETVRDEGCVDLRYPLFGSVELVRVQAEL